LVEKRKISVRFKNISTSKEFGSIISVESRNIGSQNSDTQERQTFSGEERDLQLFVIPHLYRLLRAGESTNWEEINSQLLSQALRGEEVARAWMNNIIVLGLLGTATSIAIPIFIIGYDIKEILRFLPPAFVPAAFGLFLGIICSLLLSYRLRNTHKKAEELTDKFKSYFPYPVSTADILRESFSHELRAVLKEFPEKLSQSFKSVQEDLEKIAGSTTKQLSNIPDFIRRSVEEAGSAFVNAVKEASGQFEDFSKRLTTPIKNLGEQLPLLETSIVSFGEYTKILHGTVADFSRELNKLVEHTDKNQGILINLIDKVSKASMEFEQVIGKSNELLGEFKVLYQNIHEEYSKYVKDIFSKMVNSVEKINTQLDNTVTQVRNDIADMCIKVKIILSDNNAQHFQMIENRFTELLEELYKRVDDRIKEAFLGEIGLLKELKESFGKFNTEYMEYQEILKSYNDGLKENTSQFKIGGELLNSAITKAEKTSDELRIWWDVFKGHKDGLREFSNMLIQLESSVKKMSEVTLESHKDREKKLKAILERIDDLRRTI
jgi:gas vesicle protein